MLLRRFADEISVDFAGWYLSHSKVVSRDRESLSNVSQMTDCLLRTLSPGPQVSTASDMRVLVVTTVQLLHAGQELVLSHAAHHGGDVVDDGKAVLGPGQGHVGQSDPLLQSPC